MEPGLPFLKFLAPQLPSLASTALWHSLGRTPQSSHWDLRTTLTVHVLRQMMVGDGRPRSVAKVQAATLRDPGVKGKMWVARDTFAVPEEGEEGVRDAVFGAVEGMKPDGVAQLVYTRAPLADVEVEWTGFRPEAGKEELLPEISEKEKFARLMAEPTRTSETTILYFHGGAYYLCDPSSHRAQCSRLAKECGGRVCSVRYRLAPQTAFPGQLLDALTAYLSLLYPGPDALHDAVAANDIVLAGDSAGGNLVFALLQLLLYFHRSSSSPGKTPTLLFRGREVEIPLPAGASANSGWFDIARSLPSLHANAQYDYLPPPTKDGTTSPFKPDGAWPADPPRGDLFCDLSLLDHPLVSPLVADDWRGSPPLWFSTGWEMLQDEIRVVASRARAQGVGVWYEEFEGMPHCFQMLLPFLEASGVCYRSWGEFCQRAVEEGEEGVGCRGRLVRTKGKGEEVVDLAALSAGGLGFEEVVGRVREAKDRRVRAWREEQGRVKAAL